MTDTDSKVLQTEVESIVTNVERMERVLTKLGDNDTRLITLCAELKTMTELQTKRMDRIELEQDRHKSQVEVDKSDFNRSIERIHDKIDSSEEKNEDKIDSAVDKLSMKIDHLCDKSGTRIDGLSREVSDLKANFNKVKWIIVGGGLVVGLLLSKFEFIKSLLG